MTKTDKYDEWNELKKKLEENKSKFPFREREIWWYAAGENLGSEIDGKGSRFSRPILIFRKYGETTFFGIPLSTRKSDGLWYSNIKIRGQNRCALLSQAGSYSVRRLYGRIDRISKDEFEEIGERLRILLFKK